MIDVHHGWNASYKPQIIGFVVSLLLIIAAYRIITHAELKGALLTATIFSFAFTQAIVQLIFFLHVGVESKPHWNTITFLFTLLVLFIIILGTLWIIHNLNYNMEAPMEVHAPPQPHPSS